MTRTTFAKSTDFDEISLRRFVSHSGGRRRTIGEQYERGDAGWPRFAMPVRLVCYVNTAWVEEDGEAFEDIGRFSSAFEAR